MNNSTPSAEELARQAWLVWKGIAGPARTENAFRGLVAGVVRQAEREALEKACKAQCLQCAEGMAATYHEHVRYYYHDQDGRERTTGCTASSIRALTNKSGESGEPKS